MISLRNMELATNLPISFDVNVYRDKNPDLSRFTNDELILHYHQYGKAEGRVCSEVVTLIDFIQLFPKQGDVLEIGQLDKPLCRHAKNIDIMSHRDLEKQYANDPSVAVQYLRPVDYIISNTRNWGVGAVHDAVISSHNIEHAPCMVSFLNNIAEALRPDGLAYFVIPDHRYCFDRYKFPSTIMDVLDAFYTGREKPSMGNMLEYALLSRSNETARFWSEPYIISDTDYFSLTTEQIAGVINRDSSRYYDGHCWKLTPDHFAYIVEQLYALGIINLRLLRVYPTLRNELQFFAVLQKVEPRHRA